MLRRFVFLAPAAATGLGRRVSRHAAGRWAVVCSGTLLAVGSIAPSAADAAPPAGAPEAAPIVGTVAVGSDPMVSGDGRRVVFVAASAEPQEVDGTTGSGNAPGAATFPDSVWLLDRSTGTRRELTVPVAGVRRGRSIDPVISRDGCVVAVVTEVAYDLFRDDDRGSRWDVYRTVLPGCVGAFPPDTWELVSSNDGPSPHALDSVDPRDRPASDASGSTIAYTRLPADQQARATTWSQIDVVDLTVPSGDAGRVVPLPGLPADPPTSTGSYLGQRQPALSADGRYLVATTDTVPVVVPAADPADAPTITGTWTGQVVDGRPVTQLVRWDREPNADQDGQPIRIVSVNPTGAPADDSSSAPAVDDAGDVVAFTSLARDLVVPTDPTTAPARGVAQVYRAELGAATTVGLVSARDGHAGNGASTAPAIDGAGRATAFATQATDLLDPPATLATDADGRDLLVAQSPEGTLRRVTVRPDGLPASRGAGRPSMSASGRIVVYATTTPDDTTPDDASSTNPSATAAAGAGGASTDPAVTRRIVVDEAPVALSWTAVNLGTTALGQRSRPAITTIVNHGAGSFVPAAISTSNPDFAVTGGSCVPTVPVAPGESCTVEVSFAAGTVGSESTDLVVAERGFGAAEVRVPVEASAGTPAIEAAPATISLGEGWVGLAGSPSVATFLNTGTVPTTIESLTTGGSQPADVVLSADGCTHRTLEPGRSCQVSVALLATDSGPRSATLVATAADGAIASAVVIGTGKYTPLLGIDQTVAQLGGKVDVHGLGFPANTYVTLTWDGDTGATIVGTDARGELSARVAVSRSLGSGARHLVAVDALTRYAPVTSADVRIARPSNAGAAGAAHRSG